jgi:hypothetical protein
MLEAALQNELPQVPSKVVRATRVVKEVNEGKKELLEKRKNYDPRKRAMDGDAGVLVRSRSANKVPDEKV